MRMHPAVRILGPAILLLAGLCGCLYPGVGVSGGVVVGPGGYEGDYYQGNDLGPNGYVYGGWGGGYRVGPNRSGERGPERGGRPYRSAEPSRRMPTLPSAQRGHGRP